MLGIFGILLSLILLMWLAYRGMSVIILAPILAMMAVLFNGNTPLLATYTQLFMTKMGSFAVTYFPIFLLGAIFGKLMEDSGCARSIAHWITAKLGERNAVLSIVLACGILNYGGVSAFVVAFSVYPLAAALFRELDLPKRFVPGAIALGAFTFAMTCLPGTAQIHNIIPAPYFETDVFAAPLLGILAGLAMMAGGVFWLNRRVRRAKAAGEGYGDGHSQEPEQLVGEMPSFWVAIIPIVCVIGFNYIFVEYVIPGWDTSYLSEAKYGGTEIGKLRGLWAMILSLIVACAVCAMLTYRSLARLNRSLSTAAMGSLLPTFNTASEVGYGATIASLTAFVVIKNAMINVAPGNPLLSEMLAINVLSGITGSASGGLSIALAALGETWKEMAINAGINLELMHRVASMASGGFDTLPHNGAVITLLTICGLSHRQSYKDIAMVSLVIPFFVVLTSVLILGMVL